MKNKGFSIITNFGCNFNCDYCIWKNHPLKNIFTNINNCDWDKLKEYLEKYNKISISGGGDPFFKINENWNWYLKLFELYTGKIDIHTSNILIDENSEKYKYFNKIVLHSNYKRFLTDIESIKKISNPLRLVFVINKDLTVQQVKHITEIVDNKHQLSFREMCGNKNREIIEVEDFIKESKNYFVKQGDYNIYFMPNNEIWYNFLKGENI